MPPVQDHKKVGEGDTGFNTGGMGAYCPCPQVKQEHGTSDLGNAAQVMQTAPLWLLYFQLCLQQ